VVSARLAPLIALAASAALVGVYAALGGASYEPLDVADPCEPRPVAELQERDEVTERLALSALDGAACELQVPREDLVFVIADPGERDEFIAEHGVTEEQLDAALREGLVRAVDDAERAGGISAFEATLLREVAERVPAAEAIDLLEAATGDDVLGLVDDLIDTVEDG
jgi:hypothetical protein